MRTPESGADGVDPVIDADGPERREPADAGPDRFPRVGEVELLREPVDVADVEEAGQPDVERHRDDVLGVAEDLAGAAGREAVLVFRREPAELEAANAV